MQIIEKSFLGLVFFCSLVKGLLIQQAFNNYTAMY